MVGIKRILVLGYFGYRTNQLDGQTVKTRNVYQLLVGNNEKVDFYDTQEFHYKKFSIFKMFAKVCCCSILIYLPAHNNLRYVFPWLFILSKLFRVKICYFVVGGWLREFLSNKPLHRWMLKRIDGIFSETCQMKSELEQQYGMFNMGVFPNFRFFDFSPKQQHDEGKLHLVFMARVNKMKGLDMIFCLGDYLRAVDLDSKIDISFYGPVNDSDKEYFWKNLNKYSFMRYYGELQPELMYQTLQNYDAMLLPTHYFTEGLPGSIVDAYISGIPVIVTRWKHATEFVDDGETGFIVPFENGQEELNQKVKILFDFPEILNAMKIKAKNRSYDFSAQHAKILMRNITK
ncbi:glycosyltransferase [Odoribacter laneus CAG:561]|uniref:glycosyltransferase n=1 Tax=Odoribacter laneus TaxID=626933 RepID=UPI0003382116|nr:glycosyltransferase [Odoribacter laneus]CCZ81908.1 glycosyltransferase [Odoribacter laneus CAG:561]